jgi:hypothetical protein
MFIYNLFLFLLKNNKVKNMREVLEFLERKEMRFGIGLDKIMNLSDENAPQTNEPVEFDDDFNNAFKFEQSDSLMGNLPTIDTERQIRRMLDLE